MSLAALRQLSHLPLRVRVTIAILHVCYKSSRFLKSAGFTINLLP
jgi:hypothetical protein